MKVRVRIPIELYRILVTKCSETSPEFKLLQSGVITSIKGEVTVHCEEEESSSLIEWANRCHAGAAGQIKVVKD